MNTGLPKSRLPYIEQVGQPDILIILAMVFSRFLVSFDYGVEEHSRC